MTTTTRYRIYVDLFFFLKGFVQYIQSQPLRHVLEHHRTIRQYLQSKVNDETDLNELGIPHEVLDAYVKSCGKTLSIICLISIVNLIQLDIV